MMRDSIKMLGKNDRNLVRNRSIIREGVSKSLATYIAPMAVLTGIALLADAWSTMRKNLR